MEIKELKFKLSKLEARLQSLIEGSTARLLSPTELHEGLAQSLIAAMQSGIKSRPGGQVIAPNSYILTLNPIQEELLEMDPSLLNRLSQTLYDTGTEEGFTFLQQPTLKVVEDVHLSPHEIRVEAQVMSGKPGERLADTSTLPAPVEETPPPSQNAFLIVNGTDIFPLDRAVINIGRRPDNQLVIDDPRVSRVHAQLRAIRGRYVIFDLDSTGGTFVNNQPVRQSVLYSGDVITLAGVPLVFGQENLDSSQTQPLLST